MTGDKPNADLITDVSTASAAYLFDALPDILQLDPREQFERLIAVFQGALIAFKDGSNLWLEPLTPSPI